MKYYEIRDMDMPTGPDDGLRVRVIDEDELDRRLLEIVHYDLEKSKQILLHGKVKEADPWVEWADSVADAIVGSEHRADWIHIKAALLKLKAMVEKNTGCDSTPSKP